ncbi:hypothetical protein [Streptomyces sp. NBC_00859]|uniref:hypothetical protein n=1 Tax=Streptomyces sp. NBC_00859 TaxID=2903682 RepID=UPI0038684FD9|nr:hypothetical protein OG584_33900 [Streptomyces sp. NBC_00859]
MHQSSGWWVYDATLGAPRATDLRGACSGRWRGAGRYPIDWASVDRRYPYRFDTTGPEGDWGQHMTKVRSRAASLPDDLAALLDHVGERRFAGAAD